MKRPGALELAVFGYAALNAALYASLLPLWEGFDEPFHYGYVQNLSRSSTFPVQGRAALSDEVLASLKFTPVSHVIARRLTDLTSFEQYFRLPEEERARRRAALWRIPPAWGARVSGSGGNYEAQQAPLAYLILSLPDRWWREAPLPLRVWRLRLCAALVSAAAMWLCTLGIARKLELPHPYPAAAAFLVLSCQMFYASAAHVGNDWLAAPLAGWLLLAVVVYVERPGNRTAALMGLALAAGLLAKAYFLALAPLPLAVAVWRRRGAPVFALLVLGLAGPWYARNWLLYGTISGVMPPLAGLGLRQAAASAAALPWLEVLGASARRSLWTANNSFGSFSAVTLNILLALLAVGLALWCRSATRKRPPVAGWVLLAGGALFLAFLAYSTVLLYAIFGAEAYGGAPWYTPAMFPALFCLALGGAARGGRAGRMLAAGLALAWAYLIVATWWVKLIPLYGGFAEPHARPAALAAWYAGGHTLLADTAMASPRAIYALAAVVTVLAAALASRIVWLLHER